MKKQTWLYIAVGLSVCLSIVAFSLSLYFGLRDDDGGASPAATMTKTTATTQAASDTTHASPAETTTKTTTIQAASDTTHDGPAETTTKTTTMQAASDTTHDGPAETTTKTTTMQAASDTTHDGPAETTTTDPFTTLYPLPPKNNGTQRTALDDYVFSNDSLDQFTYDRAVGFDFNGTDRLTNVSYQAYVLNMTSGMWLTGTVQSTVHSGAMRYVLVS